MTESIANRKVKKRVPVVSPIENGPAAIPFERLLGAIVNELARARIRNRTLLHLLVQAKIVDNAGFVQEYMREETEDFKPFVELLLCPPAEFKERWAGWLEKNSALFGYNSEGRVSVNFGGEGEGQAPALEAPKPRRRRSTPAKG